MKNGTRYGARIKKAFAEIRSSTKGLVRDRNKTKFADPPSRIDPLRQLAVAILGSRYGAAAGEKAADKIFETMQDWNEVRVTTAYELAATVSPVLDDALARCLCFREALSAIYRNENGMTLKRVARMKIKEARQYLQSLPGVDEYATAFVLLFSFNAHTIPVSFILLEVLRREEWVDSAASRTQVQAFLQSHIQASQAKEFCTVMEDYAFSKVKKGRPRRSRRVSSTSKSRRASGSSSSSSKPRTKT